MPLVDGHFAVNRALGYGLGLATCYGQPMTRLSLLLLIAAGILPLAACASDTANYPSLARRDVERTAATPVPSPAPIPDPGPDAALAARLAGLVAAARGAQQRFAAAQPGAERGVGAGAGSSPGSESWARASIALAGLETTRSDAMIALADLDALYAEARVNGTNGASAIAAARNEVSVLVSEQDRTVAALRGRLGD